MLQFLRAAACAVVVLAAAAAPDPARAGDAILTLALPAPAVRAALTLEDLDRLPQSTIVTATPWHVAPKSYSGPLLRDVLGAALPADGTVSVVALNDYAAAVPVADLKAYAVVLATRIDGKPIPVREKGPMFVMYPFDQHPELRQEIYYSRAVWQVARIAVK